jgi:acyl-CoA thioester hydrolase
MAHEVKLRVRYGETDAQGVVNNANYLSYFEVGRVEWMRAAGMPYGELERRGLGFLVVEANVRYRRPAFFDDELVVRARIAEVSRASFVFGYEVLREGETLATGSTRHVCVDLRNKRTRRIPPDVLALVSETPEEAR